MLLARKNHFGEAPNLADLTSYRGHHRAQHQTCRSRYRADLASGPESDEVVSSFATERYLLDELDLTLRDEFEEHLFDCQECAFDFWAGATLLATLSYRRWR